MSLGRLGGMSKQAHSASGSPGAVEPTLTLGVPAAAVALGVSERLVWRLIDQGRLEVCRIGRRVLVTRRSLEDLVAGGGSATS